MKLFNLLLLLQVHIFFFYSRRFKINLWLSYLLLCVKCCTCSLTLKTYHKM
jgi:hypothetical protein